MGPSDRAPHDANGLYSSYSHALSLMHQDSPSFLPIPPLCLPSFGVRARFGTSNILSFWHHADSGPPPIFSVYHIWPWGRIPLPSFHVFSLFFFLARWSTCWFVSSFSPGGRGHLTDGGAARQRTGFLLPRHTIPLAKPLLPFVFSVSTFESWGRVLPFLTLCVPAPTMTARTVDDLPPLVCSDEQAILVFSHQSTTAATTMTSPRLFLFHPS